MQYIVYHEKTCAELHYREINQKLTFEEVRFWLMDIQCMVPVREEKG